MTAVIFNCWMPKMRGCLNFAIWLGDFGPIGPRAHMCRYHNLTFLVFKVGFETHVWRQERLSYDTYTYVALGAHMCRYHNLTFLVFKVGFETHVWRQEKLSYDTYTYVALGPIIPKSPNQMAKFKRPRILISILCTSCYNEVWPKINAKWKSHNAKQKAISINMVDSIGGSSTSFLAI